jgi:hypothetical protein
MRKEVMIEKFEVVLRKYSSDTKVLITICQNGTVLLTFSWISGDKFIGI